MWKLQTNCRYGIGVAAFLLSTMTFPGLQSTSIADDCVADFKHWVAANGECIAIEKFGFPDEKSTSLIVYLHGDTQETQRSRLRENESIGTIGVVSVALIRPGFERHDSKRSTGWIWRDKDSYTPDNIEIIAAAIKAMKDHFRANKVILAGKSGGAAVTGIIMGKYPGLANDAVLAACPCHVPEWRVKRRGENNWPNSLSPHSFVDGVPKNSRIVAMVGSEDDNTYPSLSRDYVAALKARGIEAAYVEIEGMGHNRIDRTDTFEDAILQLIEGPYTAPD